MPLLPVLPLPPTGAAPPEADDTGIVVVVVDGGVAVVVVGVVVVVVVVVDVAVPVPPAAGAGEPVPTTVSVAIGATLASVVTACWRPWHSPGRTKRFGRAPARSHRTG